MNPNELIAFQTLMVPLAAALGLSIIVERILELAQNILESLPRRHDGRQAPGTLKVDKKIGEIEQLHSDDKDLKENEETARELRAQLDQASDPAEKQKLKDQLKANEDEGEFDERPSKSVILVEPATDADDGLTTKRFILQLLGFAAGIILARASGVQLFNSFLVGELTMPVWADYLLTGLLIGGGSAPIHTLIRFITERKVITEETPPGAEQEEKEPEAEAATAPAIIFTPSDVAAEKWVDIPYKGGVDRDLLENVHKRVIKVGGQWKPINPNMIVYHHTTMDSRSTFENVVRVIKSRKTESGKNWLTGYNCVVLADGSVYPFCRWDRRGSHAAGYNSRSLGIAFNGNFEPNPRIPDSNPDGRFGDLRPTEAQLKAGARVVTLWTFLYKVDLNFEQTILPHKDIAVKPKACPGSGFPYDEFKKWVDFYRTQWEKSLAIKERIEAYAFKPYLYAA